MNQKGFANIILIVVIVILVGVVGYFAFVKKSGPIAQQPTPTPTQTKTPVSPTLTPTSKATNLKTYTNTQYGFVFMYPNNMTAWNAIDHTNGQIPDVAGFGYVNPNDYELGTRPDKYQGSARILVWTNVAVDLRSWLQSHEPNIKNWTDTKVGTISALVSYSKDTTVSEGSPMTFKTYYLKRGDKIFQIMGFSINNQYSDSWIMDFDKVVATFKID